MPQTLPSNDLIPDYQNKPGKFFSNQLKTKWFAEYAAALYGRLVGGTFSTNSYDFWIGNGGSPLQIIDSAGNWVGPVHGPEDIPDPLILGTFNATTEYQLASTKFAYFSDFGSGNDYDVIDVDHLTLSTIRRQTDVTHEFVTASVDYAQPATPFDWNGMAFDYVESGTPTGEATNRTFFQVKHQPHGGGGLTDRLTAGLGSGNDAWFRVHNSLGVAKAGFESGIGQVFGTEVLLDPAGTLVDYSYLTSSLGLVIYDSGGLAGYDAQYGVNEFWIEHNFGADGYLWGQADNEWASLEWYSGAAGVTCSSFSTGVSGSATDRIWNQVGNVEQFANNLGLGLRGLAGTQRFDLDVTTGGVPQLLLNGDTGGIERLWVMSDGIQMESAVTNDLRSSWTRDGVFVLRRRSGFGDALARLVGNQTSSYLELIEDASPDVSLAIRPLANLPNASYGGDSVFAPMSGVASGWATDQVAMLSSAYYLDDQADVGIQAWTLLGVDNSAMQVRANGMMVKVVAGNRITTTTTTPVALFQLDGAANRMGKLKVEIMANKGDGADRAWYVREYLVTTDGIGDFTIVATETPITNESGGAAAWDVTTDLADPDRLKIMATGGAYNVRWNCAVEWTELKLDGSQDWI